MSNRMVPPNGERISLEIERELTENLYQLRSVTLAPAEYHVYLHPDDFARVEPVIPRITQDIELTLSARVATLNRQAKWLSLLGRKYSRPAIETPAGGWVVHIRPALNEDLARGELGIHSRLAVPARLRSGSGAGTVRIAQTIISGTDRRTEVSEVPIVATAAASVPTAAPEAPNGPVVPRPMQTHGPRLEYIDEAGSHVFMITKDLTRIGRGGDAHWVDVSVVCGPQVSREHCRIRRDPGGKYFIQDLSAWGTFVNNNLVPKYADGRSAGEQEVFDGAEIRLADAVTLVFSVGDKR